MTREEAEAIFRSMPTQIGDITPDKTKPLTPEEIRRKQAMVAHYTYLAYIMGDVCYSILHSLCKDMAYVGQDLKGNSKQRFNRMFDHLQKAKVFAKDTTLDTYHFMSENALCAYGEYADYFKDVIVEIFNRVIRGGVMPDDIMDAIKKFPAVDEDTIVREWEELTAKHPKQKKK